MTDDDFAALCAQHPDLSFEMTVEGEIIIMAPAFSFTAARNARIAMQLGIWADQDGWGITFDSSAGFVLPNGARRSPDACWLLTSRITPQDRKSFLHLCPDFVIELRSDTDRLPPLQRKLEDSYNNVSVYVSVIEIRSRRVTISAKSLFN